jgi:hypothetical protein
MRPDDPNASPHFWAFSMLDNIVTDFPDEALLVISEILKLDASSAIIPSLAAGPVEDLLTRHGSMMIEKVEAEALRNPSFRNLLGGVWQNKMPSEIWERICAIRDRRGWDEEPREKLSGSAQT